MKEQVVIKQVQITLMGESQRFQIKIPRNAERIIGIETGIIKMSINDEPFTPVSVSTVSYGPPTPVPAVRRSKFQTTFFYRCDLLIGELRLQSLEEANIFFVSDVYEQDLNFIFADYSIIPYFSARAWTHGRQRHEEVIKVSGKTTIIQGLFKDKLGELINKDTPYTVNIYVWYEIKDEPNDNQPCP